MILLQHMHGVLAVYISFIVLSVYVLPLFFTFLLFYICVVIFLLLCTSLCIVAGVLTFSLLCGLRVSLLPSPNAYLLGFYLYMVIPIQVVEPHILTLALVYLTPFPTSIFHATAVPYLSLCTLA